MSLEPGGPVLSRSCGLSHVAVVTADLDGFRSFYEATIGLRTTMVFGAGPGHPRQAVLMAGHAMLHVFEVAGHDPSTHGLTDAMFERGRLDHLGFAVPDPAALAPSAIGCWSSMPRAGTSIGWDRCSPSDSSIPTGWRETRSSQGAAAHPAARSTPGGPS